MLSFIYLSALCRVQCSTALGLRMVLFVAITVDSFVAIIFFFLCLFWIGPLHDILPNDPKRQSLAKRRRTLRHDPNDLLHSNFSFTPPETFRSRHLYLAAFIHSHITNWPRISLYICIWIWIFTLAILPQGFLCLFLSPLGQYRHLVHICAEISSHTPVPLCWRVGSVTWYYSTNWMWQATFNKPK